MLNRVFFITCFFTIAVSSASANLPDFTQLVEKAAPAVVKINTVGKAVSQKEQSRRQGQTPDMFRDLFEQRRRPSQPSRTMGSGFVISADGYILTNHHVVDNADEIEVQLADRSQYSATVIGSDRLSDLALLKIEADNLPTLDFADPDNLKVGAWVLAIGSPFGLDYSVTAGIVSAIGRSLPTADSTNYVPFIQTDVAINPGNSGGPLFNLDGEVVGINSQIYSRSGGSIGLSFAIPVSVANNVVKQLKSNGKVQRGWLGVGIQSVNKKLAEALDLPGPQGALVTAVVPDSPAEKSDIKPGDVIVSFDAQSILDSEDLPHIVGLITPGEEVKVEIFREGRRKKMLVEIGALDRGEDDVETANDGSDRLGLLIEELSEDELRSLRLRGGVKVARVSAESPSEIAGLIEDDVIVQLGYSRIDDGKGYERVIDGLPNDTPIPIRFYRRGQAIFRTIQLND
ncbi:MAG TPA: DegQ family serine endoprotease [Porticoccaceae bacterium]|nr:DegQ family serine endoprotease [Porticoccaceae bacterium]HIK80610.1 DegQ family serine endoprotease [Porticoccaceae bacterium]